MATQKFLAWVAGKYKELTASTTSTPYAIPAMDSSGRLDASMMPVGVGAEIVICPAFEALVTGNYVNLFLSGGVIKAQKADAT